MVCRITFNRFCLVKVCVVIVFVYVALCYTVTYSTPTCLYTDTDTDTALPSAALSGELEDSVNLNGGQEIPLENRIYYEGVSDDTDKDNDTGKEWDRLKDETYMISVEKELKRRNDFVGRKCQELAERGIKVKHRPSQFRNFPELRLGNEL